MFKFINKKPSLKVDKLIRTIRDIKLSNAIIEESDYMTDSGYNKIIVKLDKVNIIDIIKIDSFSKEEEHNIEIELEDNSNKLIVYKSPPVYVSEENNGRLLIKDNDMYLFNRSLIKNDVVKWIIKGNWCKYIVFKINELELEIESLKLKQKTEGIKREEKLIREKSNKVKNFNNLFKVD
ncbi:MAG: hypothetical protein ACREVX_08640 [Clostridium sp.]|uniref:hypothetical protein n=1 Tax=Clostridium sp. TaxID=1506 RepID=UPI003D6DA441